MFGQGRVWPAESGVVEQNVDLTEGVDGRSDHALDVGGLRDVDAYRHRDIAEQLRDVAFLPAEVSAADAGSFVGESSGRCSPDTGAGAGDDGDLAPQAVLSHLNDPPAATRA